MPHNATHIEISNLSKIYKSARGDVHALSDVNLKIKRGSSSLLGPSGCGKSTLLGIISGFHKPTSGVLLQNGREITGQMSRAQWCSKTTRCSAG
jgi:NitT/TauT family transport system ATP-binding protein